MRIAIITDSTSDISPEQAEVHNILVIPTILIIDGKEYLDGKGITREEYYQQLPELNPPPTTSAPSAGTFAEAYELRFNQGFDHIISIHVASTLSGVYNAAKVGAKDFGDRVTVIDSQSLSLGLGFQAIAAAEAAASGAGVEQIGGVIEDVRKRARVLAMLDTLVQLKRGGRVSWVRASFGELFRVKLFVEIKDGEVLRLGQTRTRKKGIIQLSQILEELGPLERLAMLHTNAEEEARAMLNDLSPETIHSPFICNVTPVVGTHVGVRALGFAAVVRSFASRSENGFGKM
jgi:DegV family protein with EDD domain